MIRFFLVLTGRFARILPGVYRLFVAPVAQHDDLLLAWVWSNYRGAISHESGLELYGLSDVMPSRVQLTVSTTFGRRSERFDLHRSDLPAQDAATYEGVFATRPARSIVDAASARVPMLGASPWEPGGTAGVASDADAVAAGG